MAASIEVDGFVEHSDALIINTACVLEEVGGIATTWVWTFKSVPVGSARVDGDLLTPTTKDSGFTPVKLH